MIHESDKFSTVFEDFRKYARDFFFPSRNILFILSSTGYICRLSIEATIWVNVQIYGGYYTSFYENAL
jgi:hypothetical protein